MTTRNTIDMEAKPDFRSTPVFARSAIVICGQGVASGVRTIQHLRVWAFEHLNVEHRVPIPGVVASQLNLACKARGSQRDKIEPVCAVFDERSVGGVVRDGGLASVQKPHLETVRASSP
eukprot:CAMPEP_0204113512 /NCGR_PEP_ID=MMETSP0361-20130328/3699_1 /ASSEMBLY_ACC=CAM_ASM_000343 /TAXON_ID=268821 /ORGANISM="Scrippsiella Hangoei, Strain SHTV-5" /LENGTH=118 /DNA_ID=CAMNT_0051063885 /DNA_START=193 /DNA_END=546 /DNA_ORIENTATION=+